MAHEPAVVSLLGIAHTVQDRLESALATLGLSMAKYEVLRILTEAGEPLTPSDLAGRLQCVRSNMTQVLDRMARSGLIRRQPDPRDRRSIRVELTPDGLQAHAAASRVLADTEKELVASFSPADQQMLQALMARLSP